MDEIWVRGIGEEVILLWVYFSVACNFGFDHMPFCPHAVGVVDKVIFLGDLLILVVLVKPYRNSETILCVFLKEGRYE